MLFPSSVMHFISMFIYGYSFQILSHPLKRREHRKNQKFVLIFQKVYTLRCLYYIYSGERQWAKFFVDTFSSSRLGLKNNKAYFWNSGLFLGWVYCFITMRKIKQIRYLLPFSGLPFGFVDGFLRCTKVFYVDEVLLV